MMNITMITMRIKTIITRSPILIITIIKQTNLFLMKLNQRPIMKNTIEIAIVKIIIDQTERS